MKKLVFLLAVVLAASARASQFDLDEGLPVEVSDAYPLGYLQREVQVRAQYRFSPEGREEARLEPRFELGLPYNGQLSLRVPVVGGGSSTEATHIELGRIALEYLYNFNQETLSVPAFSLVAGVEAPGTREGGSFDPYGRVVLSKMIPGTRRWMRLHFNALVQGNVSQAADERAARYQLIVGYDLRLSATISGVVDVVRELPLRNHAARTFGELGVRIQVTPLLALTLGGGGGASDEGKPLARGTLALQWFAF